MSARVAEVITTASRDSHDRFDNILRPCYTAPRCFRRRFIAHAINVTTRFSGTLPFLRNALAVWPETSPGVLSLIADDPWFFIRPRYLVTASVPSQLNRDDAHVNRLFARPWCWTAVARQSSNPHHEEFDPGSGRTLAACLMHASRTQHFRVLSGARLSSTWEHALQWGITPRKRC